MTGIYLSLGTNVGERGENIARAIAASLSEEEDAIEEIYEPYLMQLGLLDRTQRGRVATALAYKHFGLDEPKRQPGLFS
jgi:Holliday junction DNA helicase RuvB